MMWVFWEGAADELRRCAGANVADEGMPLASSWMIFCAGGL